MIACSDGPAPNAMIDANSVCASVRPARSNTTVTRSPISLKIGERDERMSTVAISCDMASTRRCSTEARMGSAVGTVTARGRGCSSGDVGDRLAAAGRDDVAVGHVGDAAAPLGVADHRVHREHHAARCSVQSAVSSASTTSRPIHGSSMTSWPRPCPDQYDDVAPRASTASSIPRWTSAGARAGHHRAAPPRACRPPRRGSAAPGRRSGCRTRPRARTPSSSRGGR